MTQGGEKGITLWSCLCPVSPVRPEIPQGPGCPHGPQHFPQPASLLARSRLRAGLSQIPQWDQGRWRHATALRPGLCPAWPLIYQGQGAKAGCESEGQYLRVAVRATQGQAHSQGTRYQDRVPERGESSAPQGEARGWISRKLQPRHPRWLGQGGPWQTSKSLLPSPAAQPLDPVGQGHGSCS